MRRVCLVVLALLAFAGPAFAQAVGDQCAESFDARLVDAKNAVVQFDAFMAGYAKAKPALEYFEAHCRFLDDIERVVRKVDDPNAFVCDPKAGARPKDLTAELVLTYSTLPTIGSYQERRGDNDRCLEADKAARIPLLLTDLQLGPKLELMCYRDEREKCVKAREALAAARAKGVL